MLEGLTDNQKKGLIDELRRLLEDYPYYAQKYLKIAVKLAEGVGLVPLVLNRA